MAGEFQSIVDALKVTYSKKAIEVLINEETPFRKALKKMVPAANKPKGGVLRFYGRLATPQNVAQTGDGGSLVEPKDQADTYFTLTPTIFTGAFKIGWKTRAVAKDNTTSFNGGELRRRTEDTLSDLAKFIEQTYVGTNGSGVRAIVEGALAAPATVVPLENPIGARLLRVNQLVSFRQGTGAGVESLRGTTPNNDALRIASIDATVPSAHTITLATATNTTNLVDGDGIIIVPTSGLPELGALISSIHSVDGATKGIHANGLRGLVGDSTSGGTHLQGLLRSAAPGLANAQVRANGGVLRNLTESVLISAFNNQVNTTGKRVTDIWTNTGQVEKYIEFVTPDRRVMAAPGRAPRYATGYDDDTLVHYAPGVAAKFNVSLDIIPREMYLLNWSTFFHYVAEEMDWWDAPMLKPTPGGSNSNYKASYLANLGSIENIGNDAPAANTVIRDLRDPLVGDA